MHAGSSYTQMVYAPDGYKFAKPLHLPAPAGVPYKKK